MRRGFSPATPSLICFSVLKSYLCQEENAVRALKKKSKKKNKNLHALYFLWKWCHDHLVTAWRSYHAFCWMQSMRANHLGVPEDSFWFLLFLGKTFRAVDVPQQTQPGLRVKEVTFPGWVKWKFACFSSRLITQHTLLHQGDSWRWWLKRNTVCFLTFPSTV